MTCHEPVSVYTSHDSGASFGTPKKFDEGFCDVDIITWPNGHVNLSFIKPQVAGLASYYSFDHGGTFHRGVGVDGPLDREWLATNLSNGELYMDYSHGYIGGPKSTGVFLAASENQGKTFKQRSRIDKEPAGDYPVDPYLTSSSNGRIYAMWSTSRDYNTIDRFDFAYSTDGGHTFTGHKTMGTVHKDLVDNDAKDSDRVDSQERWILGCFAASGPKKLVVIVPDFGKVTVDGKEYHPLLLYYRVSEDGGATFSEPKTVTPEDELQANIRSFEANKKSTTNFPIYVQTLPWACSDPYGRFYIAYQDNRSGQAPLSSDGDKQGPYYDKWQVRFAAMTNMSSGFEASERVSEDTICKRPPLDFLSCAADSKRAYVSWTETPGNTSDWAFSGNLLFARKILEKPAGG